MPKLTIAIDGPAGSGKSSVARRVAAMLGYLYLDSGAMYRALALKALQHQVTLEDQTSLAALAKETHIELRAPNAEQEAAGAKNCVFLDGADVTQAIRTGEVAQAASRLATIAKVREVLVAEQQRAGAGGGVVMEGRDIGTVVFPKAELKIFLDASPEVRAERRWKEHQEKGERITLPEVFDEVIERDKRDRERKVSPLVRAADAVLVDNTAMGIEETARLIVMLALSAGSALFLMPLLAVAQTSSSSAEATRKFRAYLDEDWKRWMQEYPETATSVGFPGQNRRWSDDSQEGIEARIRHLHESLAKLESISRDTLPAEEQLNYDLYRELLETAEEGLQYGDDPAPFRDVVPHNV